MQAQQEASAIDIEDQGRNRLPIPHFISVFEVFTPTVPYQWYNPHDTLIDNWVAKKED